MCWSVGRHQLCGPSLELSGVRNCSRLPLPASGGNMTSQLLKEQTPQGSAPSPAGSLLAGVRGCSSNLGAQPKALAGCPVKSDPFCAYLAGPVLVVATYAQPPFPRLHPYNLCGVGYRYIPGFLNLGTADIWGWIILHCGAILCIVGHVTASGASTK